MTEITEPQLKKINDILKICRANSVSLTIHYSEVENGWWLSIDSVAPSESYISKTYSLDGAINMTNEFITKTFKD